MAFPEIDLLPDNTPVFALHGVMGGPAGHHRFFAGPAERRIMAPLLSTAGRLTARADPRSLLPHVLPPTYDSIKVDSGGIKKGRFPGPF